MDVQTVHRHPTGLATGIGRRTLRAARRVPAARLLGLALAVVLMATLLAPLASPAGAAGDPGATDETGAALQSDAEETPVVQETPVAEETPVIEETPDADGTTNTALVGESTARIVVFNRGCTTDYGSDFFQWDTNCGSEVPNAAFEVYGTDYYGGGLHEYGTTFLDLHVPGGQYTIRVDIPQGYYIAAVFCTKGVTAVPYAEVVTYEGYYEFTLTDTEHIGCHFFQLPQGPAPTYGYGSLKLGFSVCPPAEEVPLPSFDYATATISDLVVVCSIYLDGAVSFNLFSSANGNTITTAVEPGNGGTAAWGGVPEGAASLNTEGWTSYGTPRVFCYYTNDQTNIFEATVTGRAASLTIQANVLLVCDWFDIPGPAPLSGGNVAILAHDCDNLAFDPYAAARDELIAACPPYTGDEVTFELAHQGDGTTETSSTGATGDGAALWEGVPGGDLTITETAGARGPAEPVVFCSSSDPRALVFESVFAPVQVQNRSFGYELLEGYSLYCDWFHIPAGNGNNLEPDADSTPDPDGEDDPNTDGGDGSVTVVNYACPEGAGELDGAEAYAEACTAAAEGVNFKLDGESSGNPGDSPTDATGTVSWDEREADHYYLYEELPAGFGEPVVFCGTGQDLQPYAPTSTPDAEPFTYRIEFDLADGEQFACSWFDVPTDQETDQEFADAGGNVVVTTWVCPEGYVVYDLSLNELYELCSELEQGAGFLLYGAATELQGATDEDGRLTFGPLAAGDYRLSEDLPDGYGDPIVSCWLNVGQGALGYETAPEFVEVGGQNEYGIGIGLQSGTTWFCDWFNVPVSDAGDGDGDGSTTVVESRCAGRHALALNNASCAAGDTGGAPATGNPGGGSGKTAAGFPALVGKTDGLGALEHRLAA